MRHRFSQASDIFTAMRAELPASVTVAYPLAQRYNAEVDILSEEFPIRLDEFKIAPHEFGEDGVDAYIFAARMEALTRFLGLFREQTEKTALAHAR